MYNCVSYDHGRLESRKKYFARRTTVTGICRKARMQSVYVELLLIPFVKIGV